MSRESQPASLPRVFCDADVLIAGAGSTTGASHIVLQLSELTLLDCVTSRHVVDEVERNLDAKLPAALPAFRLILEAAARVVPDPSSSAVERVAGQAHEKDAPILAAALSSGADFLVTFNTRNFRPRKASPVVVEPGALLVRIRSLLRRIVTE